MNVGLLPDHGVRVQSSLGVIDAELIRRAAAEVVVLIAGTNVTGTGAHWVGESYLCLNEGNKCLRPMISLLLIVCRVNFCELPRFNWFWRYHILIYTQVLLCKNDALYFRASFLKKSDRTCEVGDVRISLIHLSDHSFTTG